MWLFPHMTKVTCLHSHNFMKVNDFVIISPHHSLKFAGKVGQIKKIIPGDGLYLKIQFDSNPQLFGFYYEEVTLLSKSTKNTPTSISER